MTSAAIFFTIFYILMSICFIFPPSEFVSLGLTVQCIFTNWLGSENECFVQYHIRRTVITLIFHSLLPLGYLLGLSCTEDADVQYLVSEGNIFWYLFVCSSIICPLVTVYIVYCWHKSRWKLHPISKTLQKFCNQNSNWASVAADINTEFRRIDKICIETNSIMKVIATDNWIIKVLPYWLDVAHQSDSALILSSSDTHTIAPSGAGGVQYLNIEVKSTRTGIKPFSISIIFDRTGWEPLKAIIGHNNDCVAAALSFSFTHGHLYDENSATILLLCENVPLHKFLKHGSSICKCDLSTEELRNKILTVEPSSSEYFTLCSSNT